MVTAIPLSDVPEYIASKTGLPAPHKQTVYKWSQSGFLPAWRMGNRLFVKIEQLDAWIDAHCGAEVPQPA